jgi:uncharacterized damage-inducible protein DinB
MSETLVETALDGYPLEIGAALWRLEDARAMTLRLLKNLPDNYADRQTGGNSIGTILYHVALSEADWLFTEILEEPYPDQLSELLPVDARDEAGLLTFVQGQALSQHLERLRAVRAILLERLRGLTAQDFHRIRSFPQYDVTPAWVLHHLAQHEAEHRGELGSLIAGLKSGG